MENTVPIARHSPTMKSTEALSCDRMGVVSADPAGIGVAVEVSKKPVSQKDDLEDLIRLAQEGDMLALEAIYGKFKTPLFNIAYRYTYDRAAAEDLLHDIFIKIFSNIHSLDRNKAFVGWIYRVAINTCLSYLRSRKSQGRSAISLADVEKMGSYLEDERREAMKNKPLDEAIRSLPSKLKSVFLLHDLQGYKHKEIAEILGWSVGTSKSQLFKARMKIREKLEGKDLL